MTNLCELEERERRGAVVRVLAAQDGVDLRVVARVAEAEQEAAQHGELRRRPDVRHVHGVAERRRVRQVDEDEEEAGHVDQVAHDHHRVAAPARRFAAEDAEESST